MKRSYCYTFNYGITIEQRENLICTDKIFIPVLQKKKKKNAIVDNFENCFYSAGR